MTVLADGCELVPEDEFFLHHMMSLFLVKYITRSSRFGSKNGAVLESENSPSFPLVCWCAHGRKALFAESENSPAFPCSAAAALMEERHCVSEREKAFPCGAAAARKARCRLTLPLWENLTSGTPFSEYSSFFPCSASRRLSSASACMADKCWKTRVERQQQHRDDAALQDDKCSLDRPPRGTD